MKPNMSVYAGNRFAVRAISEGLRQEVGEKLRVTIILIVRPTAQA